MSEILQRFEGPYPLDIYILSALISPHPGIYIWCENFNGRRVGYVGKATQLLNRLIFWAAEIDNAEVYYMYAEDGNLNQLEQFWISKAGDLNKV